jgi:hypothetical protein
MSISRLHDIAFVFPNADPDSRAFFAALLQILGGLPQADAQPNHIRLTPMQPAGALPTTSFRSADVSIPQIVCTPVSQLDIHFGEVYLGAGTQAPAIAATDAPAQNLLSIQELARRLDGHVTRLDHTGANLPTMLVEQSRWDALLRQYAASAALYRYPGEDWPFLIPSTEQEFEDDIRHFVLGREPKFELVYDSWTSEPVFQFSLGTDLPRAEVEARFPEGVGLPGLDDIFWSVYIAHPWPQLIIRFDLYYQGDGSVSDWDTGEWLITNGGRIR